VDFDGDDGEKGEGDDIGWGIDEIRGGASADTIFYRPNLFSIWGGPGPDTLYGLIDPARPPKNGSTSLFGGAGNDRLVGGPFLDLLEGDDVLRGGRARDLLKAGEGSDVLFCPRRRARGGLRGPWIRPRPRRRHRLSVLHRGFVLGRSADRSRQRHPLPSQAPPSGHSPVARP
jgi:Ca2+-binding RTX toxin-like protein